jgi:hypothetical protein
MAQTDFVSVLIMRVLYYCTIYILNLSTLSVELTVYHSPLGITVIDSYLSSIMTGGSTIERCL